MDEAVPITPPEAPVAAKRRGRRKQPAIVKENLVGQANLAVLQRVQDSIDRMSMPQKTVNCFSLDGGA
jgi:hypothetical protein